MKIAVQKFFTHIWEMLSSAWGVILLLVSTLIQSLFSIEGFKFSLMALGVVFLVDFITGCWASWKEFKGQKSWSFFESKKFRESIAKAGTYFIFIGMGWILWKLFFDAPIKLPFSTKGVNIIQIFFGICIAIESWSILENMKRLGFDLIGRISKTAEGFWQTIKKVKNG